MRNSKFQYGLKREAKAGVLMVHASEEECCGGTSPRLPDPCSVSQYCSHLQSSSRGGAHRCKPVKSRANSSDHESLRLLGSVAKLGDHASRPLGSKEPNLLNWDPASAPTSKVHSQILCRGFCFKGKPTSSQLALKVIRDVLGRSCNGGLAADPQALIRQQQGKSLCSAEGMLQDKGFGPCWS